jgi:predicted RND superfamily exporter protein
LDAICEKIIGNERFIENYHNELYSNAICRLNYKNNIDIEQIINYVIPLEVSEKLGIDISKEEELQKFIDPAKIPENIKKIFSTKQKVIEEKKEVDKATNIFRYCKFNHDQVPKNIEDEFLKYIEDMGDNDFDFQNSKFVIEDIGEVILIALYEWNNSSNKKEGYASFNEKIETTTMNKDLIISKYKTQVNVENKVDIIWDMDF